VTIPAGNVTAPILLYHHVTDASDKLESRYNVNPEKFEEQMKWLYDNGYQTITVTALADLMRNGGEIPQRPVLITFDDGNLDNYQYAYPILKKYGFVATLYMVDNYINGKDMISSDQLKELIQNGWEIGSHGRSHTKLTAEGVDLADEIRLSKLDMEEKLGVTINSFAYPFGEINDEVIRLTVSYGFTSAVGLGVANSHTMNSIYYLDRIEIYNEYSMEKFISFFPWSGPIQ
jgi:peptidoglycan/xylan/chitin deacetylase (PgdA/CDA1 family)